MQLTGCSNDQNDPMVVRHKAMLAEQRGDIQTALKLRGDFIKVSPNYYFINEVHFEQGMNHLSLNEYEKALEHFNLAIEDDPRYTQAFIRRCQTHTALGNHEEAIRDAQRAMELSETDRNLGIAFLNQGDSHSAMEKYGEALVSWRISLLFDPAQVTALQRVFAAYMEMEEYEEALQLVQNSLRQNDRAAAKHLMLSQALANLDRLEEAESALKRARELDTQKSLELPESAQELVHSEDEFEEAPMGLPLQAASQADPDIPLPIEKAPEPLTAQPSSPKSAASQQLTPQLSLTLARKFLNEIGIQILKETPSALSGNYILVCKEKDHEFEVLLKLNHSQQPETVELSQKELEEITGQNPSRGMLVIGDFSQKAKDNASESARVTAFSRSWKPDPARMIPVQFEYKIPTSSFPASE